MLRVPLDRGSGTLRATPAAYVQALCAEALPAGELHGAERLATYNRQYWFRLFGVLQREHRLTNALLGAWVFNELAARFVIAQPPRGHDLGSVADGFASFLSTALVGRTVALGPGVRSVPSEAVLQAARIDQGFRQAFWAPAEAPLTTAAYERVGAALGQSRLRAALSLTIVQEDWDLLSLRKELSATPEERPRPLPPNHPKGPRWAAIHRVGPKAEVVALAPLQGRLMQLLDRQPLADALAALEAECPPSEKAQLAEHVRGWLAGGVRLGFWTGIEA
jgi:hypothetical protein